MTVPDSFRIFVEELFAVFGPVSIRNMFGGGGVFHDGIMFAIIANEMLYLKVDDSNRPDFEAEGMGPFAYTAKGKTATMSYWEVPERLYDDADEFAIWAAKAYAVALKAKKK